MKKGNVIIAVITSAVSVVLLAAAGLIVCRKLFNKKYFTVNE